MRITPKRKTTPEGLVPNIPETSRTIKTDDVLLATSARKGKMGKNASISADGFTALFSRMMVSAFVCYENPYFIAYIASGVTDQWSSLLTARQFPVGNYEWYGKMTPQTNSYAFAGFEFHHGYTVDGVVMFFTDGTAYKVRTGTGGSFGTGGANTDTTLSGQDWTTEKLFKIEWTSAQVKFYVAGSLVATHTTNIPNLAMPFFLEAGVAGTASGGVARSYVKQETLKAV